VAITKVTLDVILYTEMDHKLFLQEIFYINNCNMATVRNVVTTSNAVRILTSDTYALDNQIVYLLIHYSCYPLHIDLNI
jgi:hypothetical protein